MPALITHRLFGEAAAARLPEGILATEEELLTFLLANQGPDPLFARFGTWPRAARQTRRLAREMHGGAVVEALLAARDAAARLPEGDKGAGRAFVLGLLGHYVLDSRAHPFVYAQQAALIAANHELAEAKSGVHAIIESDLDTWMLWSRRGQTVADVPTAVYLDHTNHMAEVGGAILAQVATQVFGMPISAGEYGGALRDYRLVYAIIEPADSSLSRVAVRLERAFRTYSQAAALAHLVRPGERPAAANLNHRPWTDCETGAVSTSSFDELYEGALDVWPAFAEALARGSGETLSALADGLNYDGVPCA